MSDVTNYICPIHLRPASSELPCAVCTEKAEKLKLTDIPRREPKEEVCEHCGATYTGLFHCQSIKNIREIEDDFAIGVITELLPSKREVVPITPLGPDGLLYDPNDK
jgi:hypothetical protein